MGSPFLPRAPFDYTIFGAAEKPPEPDERVELTFEKIPGNRVTYNRWTINGKSWPDTDPLMVKEGKTLPAGLPQQEWRQPPAALAPSQFRTHQFQWQANIRDLQGYRGCSALQRRRSRLCGQ